jgi:putative phosphoesterase
MSDRQVFRVGVVADTHGYLSPDVLETFEGVDHIIHAGDVGDGDILRQLERIAPVTAVAALGGSLPSEADSEVGGIRFVVGHKRKRVMKRLAAGKIGAPRDDSVLDLVVVGHEHAPSASWVDGVLFLCPGSASAPYEEDDAPTCAVVERAAYGLSARFVPVRPQGRASTG